MMYASTSNPHHLPPSSVHAIGTTDRANHNYDTSDFLDALKAHNLPAVSFIKAPAYENGHPGNSDPTSEQNWLVSMVDQIMQSSSWDDTAIFITYDDSDGWYDHVNGPIASPSATAVDALAGPGNCGKPLHRRQPGALRPRPAPAAAAGVAVGEPQLRRSHAHQPGLRHPFHRGQLAAGHHRRQRRRRTARRPSTAPPARS